MLSTRSLCLLFIVFVLLAGHANAFGAGNIASIAKIEGKNWRHGDIEDMLKTIAFIKHHKWTSMTIKRVYFGNWLRDYSQALDVGTLKNTNATTVRILVWILSFMSFGYATAEFEVTDERLGVYRPEEHIDNPKDYAENQDATQYDSRLRPPVMPEELAIDPQTGMKNYIANESGGWATSLGYIKHSFTRSIHFGRVYTNGAAGTKGREPDLCEALRCLGQGLHCLEDLAAHSNYVELVLRELGFHEVFPHVGSATQINLGGKQVYPLVTGTFGGVDFMHSVLGEATDHVTQSEVDEMNKALGAAAQTSRGVAPEQGAAGVTSLLSMIPGTGGLCQEAVDLQRAADTQAAENAVGMSQASGYSGYGPGAPQPLHFAPPPTMDTKQSGGYDNYGPEATAPPAYTSSPAMDASQGGVYGNPSPSGAPTQQFAPPPTINAQATQQFAPPPSIDGQATQQFAPPPAVGAQATQQFAPPPTIDAQATIAKIYPILEFRDKVVRALNSVISGIPGLESLIEKIQERVTMFIMGLLAPYIQPLIKATSSNLKLGSTAVVDASGKHQYEVWTDPYCTDPTHSLLSKDHFSNVLNAPAGQVASTILQYCAPRVLYAWENPGVPLDEVLNDIAQVFHHPAVRNRNVEIHRNMFAAVEQWVQSLPQRGANLNKNLCADSVKQGRNHHTGPSGNQSHGPGPSHGHGPGPQAHRPVGAPSLDAKIFGLGSHSKVSGSPFAMLNSFGGFNRDIDSSSSATNNNLEAQVAAAVQASQPGAGGGVGLYPGMPTQQQTQPPEYPPMDYTPYDPTTYGTAYSQGYADTSGQLQVPQYGYPPQQQQQPGYGGGGGYEYRSSTPEPYPPQQQLQPGYGGGGGFEYRGSTPEPYLPQQQQQQQQQWGGQGQGQEGYGYGYGRS